SDILLAANLNDNSPNFRKAIEEHRQKHLADKAGSAQQQNGSTAKGIDGRDLTGTLQFRRRARLVFAPDRVPAPWREIFHQSVLAEVFRNGGSVDELSRSSRMGQLFRTAIRRRRGVGLV